MTDAAETSTIPDPRLLSEERWNEIKNYAIPRSGMYVGAMLIDLLANHDAQAEQVEALTTERDRLQAQLQRLLLTHFVCEVCWTSSYEPTEQGPECAMCRAQEFALQLHEENERFRRALAQLNVVRDETVRTQRATWSSVVYPLVKILNEAGVLSTLTDEEVEEAR